MAESVSIEDKLEERLEDTSVKSGFKTKEDLLEWIKENDPDY